MDEVGRISGRARRSDTQPNFVKLATPAVANCYEVERQGVSSRIDGVGEGGWVHSRLCKPPVDRPRRSANRRHRFTIGSWTIQLFERNVLTISAVQE